MTRDLSHMRSLAMVLAMLSLPIPHPALAAGVVANPKAVPTKAVAPSRPAAPARSDADIEKDIRNRFSKSKIGVEKYTVHVQGGVATIEGKTDVIQHKGVATRLARLGGASAVSNHIQISEAAKEKAAQNLETGRRRAQIKRGDARSEARSQDTTAAKLAK
jgi:osmotically-inducible protein OsmY